MHHRCPARRVHNENFPTMQQNKTNDTCHTYQREKVTFFVVQKTRQTKPVLHGMEGLVRVLGSIHPNLFGEEGQEGTSVGDAEPARLAAARRSLHLHERSEVLVFEHVLFEKGPEAFRRIENALLEFSLPLVGGDIPIPANRHVVRLRPSVRHGWVCAAIAIIKMKIGSLAIEKRIVLSTRPTQSVASEPAETKMCQKCRRPPPKMPGCRHFWWAGQGRWTVAGWTVAGSAANQSVKQIPSGTFMG